MVWSNERTSSHTQVKGILLTNQSKRSLTALRNARLIRLEPISHRRHTVSHTDDPFTAAKSNTRLIFGCSPDLNLICFDFEFFCSFAADYNLCRLNKRLIW